MCDDNMWSTVVKFFLTRGQSRQQLTTSRDKLKKRKDRITKSIKDVVSLTITKNLDKLNKNPIVCFYFCSTCLELAVKIAEIIVQSMYNPYTTKTQNNKKNDYNCN